MFTGERCLEVEDLVLSFKEKRVLKGVSFKHCEKKTYVLIGRNGSGKTTLLKVIAGLLKPESGRIRFEGVDYTDKPPWVRRFVYAPTPFPLIEGKTVKQTLESIAKLKGSSDLEQEIMEIAKRYDIESLLNRFPHQLSQGERQRVGLAAVVLAKPRVALFDEPLAHLSKSWTLEISAEISRLAKEEDIIVVVTTPRVTDSFLFGSDAEAGVLYDGRIIASGSLNSLISRPHSLEVLLGLDFYTTNIVDLNGFSELSKTLISFCGSKARYAWIRPDSVEISDDGEVEGVLERIVPETGFVVAYVKTQGSIIATRLPNVQELATGVRVKLSFKDVICFGEDKKLMR
ncbi:MAG: ABC transporter ATP-binding protein [Acidilobaceae archaeon]